MPTTKLSISLPDHTLAKLDNIGTTRSSTIAMIVERYVALIEAATDRLRTDFSINELNAIIAAAANYEMPDIGNIMLLPVFIERAFRHSPPADINARTTVSKLQLCTLAELVALTHMIDAGEPLDDQPVPQTRQRSR